MSVKQKNQILILVMKKETYTSLLHKLPKRTQYKIRKQSKKEVLSKLTKTDKKKICVSYKKNKNQQHVIRKIKTNEVNASNKVINRYLAK